jgi:Transposase DDE domain
MHRGLWRLIATSLLWVLRLLGQLFGERGYISQALHDTLFAQGLELLTKIRKNMKNRLMRWWDKVLLRKRALIEML